MKAPKTARAPKAPQAPKTPRAPKAAPAPKTSQAPKSSRAQKSSRAPTSSRAQKSSPTPKLSKAPRAAKAPAVPKAGRAAPAAGAKANGERGAVDRAAKATPTRPRPTTRTSGKTAPAAPRPDVVARGSADVDERIQALPAWQAATLARIRALIREALPDVVEEVKWRKPSNGMAGVPTFSRNGLLCTGEPYKAYVKLTFAHGAALDDPARLFNAGFGGGTRRAIDLREGDLPDAEAFKALVRQAADLNGT